eukprot:TRINITY_DN9532_c0_g1_i1.p1 TRINITY_DN9532_c0_g1~~TRINITY_DN9532_c0_g1_i1.p1  ORF type:complete len:516 (+),score=128.38 TRINITY_DN9532_c0_g1_i1:534-2081(+)
MYTQVPQLVAVADLNTLGLFDAVVVVSSSLSENYPGSDVVIQAKKVDNQVGESVTAHVVSGSLLVHSPIGQVNRDFDDVRKWSDAARAGVARAIKAGKLNPVLLFPSKPDLEKQPQYLHALEVAVLGVYQELYQPLQAREKLGDKAEPVKKVGIYSGWHTPQELEKLTHVLRSIEAGKRLARDLGESDPERMSPPNFADYVVEAFKSVSNVKVEVKSGEVLHKEYPLLTAVARGSLKVERHTPRVVRLEFNGHGDIKDTLLFSGKGVTYDTGGADVKTEGLMAGMSKDKCGASNIAGFMLTAALLNPPSLRIVAELGLVRNSIGSECYVADEILTGHSGVKVKIINTDAEGRLVLADCLSHVKADALNAVNPHLMTVATLTGHAARAFGTYSVAVDNGVAKKKLRSRTFQDSGDQWGDCFEVSTLRKEDYSVLSPANATFDVLQHANTPKRGHQFATAFLNIASGLNKHGSESEAPLAYTHLDIAGCATENGDWHAKATACTLTTLTAVYVLPKL